jgi:KUP system potassium uptake protein
LAHVASHATATAKRGYFLFLSLAALGVVFGDIGTSPLYAIQACFNGQFKVGLSDENVLGVLSLVFWSLILVVTVKYLTFVLRADNDGEGGILALMALVHPRHSEVRPKRGKRTMVLIAMGIFGAALLYGDGMITPAISVLSAVEGTEIKAPELAPFVIPITIAVLVGLFMLQRRGTAGVGKLFGPVMIVWFLVLALLGLRGIAMAPRVLGAINPVHAVRMFATNSAQGFLVLGAVFLVVTGAEALYADMGHFGRGPIRFTWLVLVLPALLLNYFGQGGLLLSHPDAVSNPFYFLAPDWALVPLILLATAATIIASQAIISGAFSLTAQAVQLGYSPRMEIRHTSEREIGQIYVPQVNWTLMIATILLVLGFQSSNRLAAAYGIAVTSTMIITTILFGQVARVRWGWNATAVEVVMAIFLAVDITFFAANVLKIVDGGWLPLAVAASIFILMTTWRQGRRVLGERLKETALPIEKFLKEIEKRAPTRVRGYAVYMTGNPRVAPPALVKNLEHNRVLHFQVALLSVVTEDVPHTDPAHRVTYEPLHPGFYRVVARYGFMDEPNAVEILDLLHKKGLHFPLKDTTFFLGRERLISSSGQHGMSFWREKLFTFMSRNAQQATAYFRIPPDRVIEVGSQVEI